MHQSAVWESLARYWTKEDALRLLCRAVVPSHKRLTLETHHSCHTTMMTAMMVIATSCHLCWTVVQVIMVVERGRVKFHNHQTELWKLWPFGLVAFWPCAMVCCGVLWCAVALWPCGHVALLPCGLAAFWPCAMVLGLPSMPLERPRVQCRQKETNGFASLDYCAAPCRSSGMLAGTLVWMRGQQEQLRDAFDKARVSFAVLPSTSSSSSSSSSSLSSSYVLGGTVFPDE